MRNVFGLALLLLSTATTAPDSARKVVDQAISHAGGWSAWTSTRSVQFRKTTVSFDADGKVTSTRVQLHRYQLNPGPKMRIESEEKGSKTVFINDCEQAWKLVDGKLATSQQEINGARNNTFGSQYVFCMPFKLRDPGTQLSDAGTEQLSGGPMVHKVRATYGKGVGDAGGLHTWWYYFDAKSGRLVANLLLYAAGRYDYTEYYDERAIGDLTLSTRRLGYDADAHGKVGPKRSEITYDQIEANVALSDDLFAPPPSVGAAH